MRLLSTERVELVLAYEPQIPAYAILSHTWGDDEVTMQQLFPDNGSSGQKGEEAMCWDCAETDPKYARLAGKKGFRKIVSGARLARRHGFDYVWIDTCCIDKTSSTELSEAINSMYQWYKDSSICYAYLADVKPTKEENCTTARLAFARAASSARSFLEIKSVDLNFTYLLSTITGIQAEILMGEWQPSDWSVACHMSWAAGRQTTRLEDMAYCLIGIFDVNLPLLYGEGKKAFIRLQETILTKDDDHSIFAWYDDNAEDGKLTGLLAESPKLFESVKNLDLDVPNHTRFAGNPSAVLAWGLRLSFRFLPASPDEPMIHQVVLNCETSKLSGQAEAPAIRLKRLFGVGNHYARLHRSASSSQARTCGKWMQQVEVREAYVKQDPSSHLGLVKIKPAVNNEQLKDLYPHSLGLVPDWEIVEAYPPAAMAPGTQVFAVSQVDIGEPFATLRLKVMVGDPVFLDVVVGIEVFDKFGIRSWCQVIESSARTLEDIMQNAKQGSLGGKGLREADVTHWKIPFRWAVRERNRKRGIDISLFLMIRHATSAPNTAEDVEKQSWATLKDEVTTPLLTHDSGLGQSLPGTGNPLSLMGKSPPLSGIDEGIAGIDIPKKHVNPMIAGDNQLGITLPGNVDGHDSSPQIAEDAEPVAQHQTETASRADGSDVDSVTRKFKELYSQHLNATMIRTLEQSCNLVEWDSAEFSLFSSFHSASTRVRVDGRNDYQFQMLAPGPRLAMPEQLLKYIKAAYMAADAIATKIKLDGAMKRGRIIFEAVKYFNGVEGWSEGSRWLKAWPGTSWAVLGGHQEALSILIENDLRNGKLSARQKGLLAEETVKPMHLAVLLREEKMMDWLLSIISQPQETDEPLKIFTATAEYFGPAARFGDFPIHLAAAYAQDPEFWEHHLDKLGRPTGSFLEETPLHRAAATGNESAVNTLLRRWPEDAFKVDRMKRSVLWHAACGNSEYIMRTLIKAGAPLETAYGRGFAPIHVATLLGNDASLRVLMQEGANINLPLDDGFNLLPIQLAVTHRQTASLEILLKAR